MYNQDKSDFLKELMRANGMSDDLFDSLKQHGEKLMNAIGLTEEHLAASIRNMHHKELSFETQDTKSASPHQDLLAMDDNELVMTIGCNLDMKSRAEETLIDIETTVLTLALLDMEVLNGGLCQFIVNPSGRFLQQVPDALRAVGANEYAEVFWQFTEDNKLDLKMLSAYHENGLDTDFDSYYALLERYPFAEFDDQYAKLYNAEPLEAKIAAYIRQNADEL